MTEEERQIVNKAIEILDKQLVSSGELMQSSEQVKHYLRLNLETDEREIFGVMFLDSKNHLICFEKLFLGSIRTVEVHPRIIAQRALNNNASAIILAHNHPSGDPQLSRADYHITKDIQKVMKLLDIRLLDHIIIGRGYLFSMAEKGIL